MPVWQPNSGREIKKVIYLHSLTVPDWRDIDGVSLYSGRSYAVARRDLPSVHIQSFHPGEDYLEYRRDFLGYGEIEQIKIARGEGSYLVEQLLNDKKLMDWLKNEFCDEYTVLEPFVVTELEERVAEQLRVPILGNPNQLRRFGEKSAFRQLVSSLGLRVVPGIEYLRDEKDFLDAVFHLFQMGAGQVVVKGDEGASSAQNLFLTNKPGWEQKVKRFLMDKGFKSGVVEICVDLALSPSKHFSCQNGDIIEYQGPWEQRLTGPNRVFDGAKFPAGSIAEPEINELNQQGLALAKKMNELGVQGPIGFDAGLLKGKPGRREICWFEANLREGGVTIPIRCLHELDAKDKPALVQNWKMRALKRASFGDLVKKFRPHLFSMKKRQGIIFINPGCLQMGMIQSIIVASTPREIEKYRQILQKGLRNLRNA
jgi:hypothetical protein